MGFKAFAVSVTESDSWGTYEDETERWFECKLKLGTDRQRKKEREKEKIKEANKK